MSVIFFVRQYGTVCVLKEGLVEVHRQLTEAGKREGVPAPTPARPGKVTPEMLQEQLALFK